MFASLPVGTKGRPGSGKRNPILPCGSDDGDAGARPKPHYAAYQRSVGPAAPFLEAEEQARPTKGLIIGSGSMLGAARPLRCSTYKLGSRSVSSTTSGDTVIQQEVPV